jgi:hypothetical protein
MPGENGLAMSNWSKDKDSCRVAMLLNSCDPAVKSFPWSILPGIMGLGRGEMIILLNCHPRLLAACSGLGRWPQVRTLNSPTIQR